MQGQREGNEREYRNSEVKISMWNNERVIDSDSDLWLCVHGRTCNFSDPQFSHL